MFNEMMMRFAYGTTSNRIEEYKYKNTETLKKYKPGTVEVYQRTVVSVS
jgi:hypothetical protein